MLHGEGSQPKQMHAEIRPVGKSIVSPVLRASEVARPLSGSQSLGDASAAKGRLRSRVAHTGMGIFHPLSVRVSLILDRILGVSGFRGTVLSCTNMAAPHAFAREGCCDRSGSRLVDREFGPAVAQKTI